MAEKSKALYEFRKQVKALKQFRGRGTELVTVYITPGYPIHEIASKLRDEYGQAANIKSKTTQKNVQGALERILNHLKTYKKTPENGVALFAGNVSEKEGRTDIQLFAIEPPMPLHTQFYRCESVFVVEPLEQLSENTDSYGLVVLDGKEATIATLTGKKINVIKHVHTTAHQKVAKGGQCVLETTRIELADGSQKEIKNAFEGDPIASSDRRRQIRLESTVKDVFRKKVSDAVEITTPSTKLVLSKEHKVFVGGAHWRGEYVAAAITPGMRVYLSPRFLGKPGERLIPEKVESVRPIPSPQEYFMDIEANTEPVYFANGILVHNSAARYDRLHTEAVEYYYKRIGEAMDAFLNVKNFKGVIVGGPGPTKENFLKANAYNYQLKVLGTVDTGYADEYGLRELLEKGQDLISQQEAVKEKQLIDRFLKEVSTNGLAAYGFTDLKQRLENRQIETLLVSEDLELKQFDSVCSQCGKAKTTYGEAFQETECSCGGKYRLQNELHASDALIEEAERQNVPVELISRDTAEGATFYATFKGLGAFLRYR